MEILLIAILIGFLPAFIAKSKGHSFFAWWFYGAALWIIAFPHSLFLKRDTKTLDNRQLSTGDMKKCPHCAEIIKAEAIVCRYCGRDMPNSVAVEDAESLPTQEVPKPPMNNPWLGS